MVWSRVVALPTDEPLRQHDLPPVKSMQTSADKPRPSGQDRVVSDRRGGCFSFSLSLSLSLLINFIFIVVLCSQQT
jgi:hypothetical protein